MSLQARGVADFRIRSHLGAALAPRPDFRLLYQFPADAVLSKLRFDVPAFQVTDVISMTILNEWTDAHLKKAGELPIARLCEQDVLGLIEMIEYVDHLRSLIIVTGFVP
jgi:hypothetical protein